ncbi:lysophospholipid acyltransferase 6 [Episyrphus balteatus]|uniref:lysophospholipid acyltransferase 6 n=1 Tax=Episyrphus balteatus TaxID=286459 RepID=UPI002486C5E6|nr:lysophospholipid acyltransferase 6 [Episyrphus balteatus]
MLEEFPIPTQSAAEEDTYYDGSRAFLWLADLCGLSVDLVNFILCQVAALFLASLFRSVLHPSRVSSIVRHTFGLSVGLVFGYICFGQQAIHIAGLPSVCYVVIRTQNPSVVQKAVMIAALTYLLCIHLHRQIYDYGSCSLDITGPLMVITQKVTSLAFSIHDGFVKEQKDMTKAQQYHSLQKLPSALEYFSFVLNFQGLMAGPLVFYRDYIDFIEGYNLLKSPTSNGNLDNGNTKEIIIEPSPTKAVIKKVIGSMVCAFIFMKFVKVYPIKTLKDPEYVSSTSFPYNLWYIMMATTIIRFKYYHAWLLADAICNNAGLGFTGYDKEGNPKWDLITNINVLSFEFASNFRDAINNWNIGTNIWLRTTVYDRVPRKYGTILTFALSAVWHGFYPGYYLTFATGAIFVTAARSARRMFRHRFQRTQFTRMFYDILTCVTTRIFMGYATFPFVLLECMVSVRLYLKLFMCLHIIAIATFVILPKLIRGDKPSKIPSNITSIVDNGNTNQNHHQLTNNDLIQQKLSDALAATDSNAKLVDTSGDSSSSHIIAKKRFIISPDRQISTTVPTALAAISIAHDQCEMDNLSIKIKEKIDMETKNIEEFIDKTVNETVSGIVEFKNDLMRDSDKIFISKDGIRKRIIGANDNNKGGSERVDAFLKKEIDAINAVVQQANVLPVVLSNGHAK